MKKKIIFVTEALWIGGIETALVNLLNQLDYTRYDVCCLILRDYLDLAERLPKQCRLLVSSRDTEVTFSEPYRFRRLAHLMEEPQTSSRVRRAEWKIFQFLFRGIEMDRYAAYIRQQLAGERFHTCVIYSDRCAEVAVKAVNAERFLMYYHHGAMRRVYHDEYGYRKSEKIIAVSERLEEQLKSFVPKYADKICSIPNVVDTEYILNNAKQPTEEQFEKRYYNVVTCGRLALEKGIDIAAEACRIVLERGFNQFRWWIVGGGPEEKYLREIIAQLGIEKHFVLLGMKKNPYPYMKNADLYVQPSRIEAFGLSIVEAVSLGKKVIITDICGASALLQEQGISVICETDAKEIADSICKEMLRDNKQSTDNNTKDWIKSFNKKAMEQINELL